jgi:hypothetical protein
MNRRISIFFLLLFVIAALLPLIQQFFRPFKLAGLQGAFVTGTMPEFSWKAWFDGNYQQRVDYYLTYNTAFNGELVRLRNQIDYTLFNRINTNLTLGKDNFLFDPQYVKALTGEDLISDEKYSEKKRHIKKVLTFFNENNIPVLVLWAPNKAEFYSEYLPHHAKAAPRTNKAVFDSILKKQNVPAIDFSSWFLKLKKNESYPLIPKYGAHWSTYGAALAGDSLLKIMTQLINKPVTQFSVTDVELSNKAKYIDDDYLASLNLMERWPSPELAYPKLNFNDGYKPQVLILSDSFIWSFYDLEIIQRGFGEKSLLRYYNKTDYDYMRNKIGSVAKPLSEEELKRFDLVLILSSDPSLTDFGFGFFENFKR